MNKKELKKFDYNVRECERQWKEEMDDIEDYPYFRNLWKKIVNLFKTFAI